MALRRHTHAWGGSGNRLIPQNREGWAVHPKKAACTLNGRLSDKVQAAFGIRLSQNKRAAGLLNGNALCHGLPPQARVWRRNAMKTLRVRYPSVQAAFGIFSSGGFAMLPLRVLPRVQAAFGIHSSRSIGSQEKILLNRRFHSGASGSFGLAVCVCGSYHCMRPCGSSRTW